MKNSICLKTLYLLYNTHSYGFSRKLTKYIIKIDLTSNFEEFFTLRLSLRIDLEEIIGKNRRLI